MATIDPFDCIEESGYKSKPVPPPIVNAIDNGDWIVSRKITPSYLDLVDQSNEEDRRSGGKSHYFAIAIFIILFVVGIIIPSTRGITGIISVLAITFCTYFLPTIVASCKNHTNGIAILVLNLFLGWTFLGWVIALVWACMDSQTKK